MSTVHPFYRFIMSLFFFMAAKSTRRTGGQEGQKPPLGSVCFRGGFFHYLDEEQRNLLLHCPKNDGFPRTSEASHFLNGCFKQPQTENPAS